VSAGGEHGGTFTRVGGVWKRQWRSCIYSAHLSFDLSPRDTPFEPEDQGAEIRDQAAGGGLVVTAHARPRGSAGRTGAGTRGPAGGDGRNPANRVISATGRRGGGLTRWRHDPLTW
jgi:hypothetical protein